MGAARPLLIKGPDDARYDPIKVVPGLRVGTTRSLSNYPQRVLLRSIVRPSKAPAAPPKITPSVRSPPRPASS